MKFYLAANDSYGSYHQPGIRIYIRTIAHSAIKWKAEEEVGNYKCKHLSIVCDDSEGKRNRVISKWEKRAGIFPRSLVGISIQSDC